MVKITNVAGGAIDFPGHGVTFKSGANYLPRVPGDLHGFLLAQPGVFRVELVKDSEVPAGAEILELAGATDLIEDEVGDENDARAAFARELEAERLAHADQLKAKGLEFDNDLADERKLFDDQIAKERAELEQAKAAHAAEVEAFSKAKADKPAEG